MGNYHIARINENSFYVTLMDSKSAYDHAPEIARTLRILKKKEKLPEKSEIIIDQMLHTGNTEKRFFRFVCENGVLKSDRFVSFKKDSIQRQISHDRFKHMDLEKIPTLNSVQKRMIEKGIVI